MFPSRDLPCAAVLFFKGLPCWALVMKGIEIEHVRPRVWRPHLPLPIQRLIRHLFLHLFVHLFPRLFLHLFPHLPRRVSRVVSPASCLVRHVSCVVSPESCLGAHVSVRHVSVRDVLRRVSCVVSRCVVSRCGVSRCGVSRCVLSRCVVSPSSLHVSASDDAEDIPLSLDASCNTTQHLNNRLVSSQKQIKSGLQLVLTVAFFSACHAIDSLRNTKPTTSSTLDQKSSTIARPLHFERQEI